MPPTMFIETLGKDPKYFLSVVATVILSIIFHELAHGLTAVRLGDDTPRVRGHLTLNPIVHMPPFAILTLVLAGIAWGSMPITPSRLRGRYAEAQVALAGPMTNLVLAAIALTIVGLWQAHTTGQPPPRVYNTWNFLWVFGTVNVALFAFNLLPIPPLDGSHILGNFSPSYRQWVSGSPQVALALFAGAFFLSRYLFEFTRGVSEQYVTWLNGGTWGWT